MIFGRHIHSSFLEDELNAQVEDFKLLLRSPAIGLLEERKLFLGLFIKFNIEGEMILMMPWKRGLPRKNDQFYCFLLPDGLRKHNFWGDLSYGELIKQELCATDIKCVWHGKSDNEQFALVGFTQIAREFMQSLQKNGKRVTLVIGPKVPPYEYLQNLRELVLESDTKDCILYSEYQQKEWAPILLDKSDNISNVLLCESESSDIIILQGPPGTGKTYHIAKMCEFLCKRGRKVLVTALTNQALMSVAEQLKNACQKQGVGLCKTALTANESHACPYIEPVDDVIPISGSIVLGTFYKMSSSAILKTYNKSFDYVIVDEASQAYLATLSAAFKLGRKNVWVGDVNQMPPISLLSENRKNREGYGPLIDGLSTVVNSAQYKTFQLTYTHRLGPRGADFTGMFYNNTLKSARQILFKDDPLQDGPILVTLEMEQGNSCPLNAIHKALELANNAIKYSKAEVAILSHRIETVQSIQREAVAKIEKFSSILVETVARVQGITKDIVIFLVPNTDSMVYCFEKRLFNVATSRARWNTYIIVDSNFDSYQYGDGLVMKYLRRIANEKKI